MKSILLEDGVFIEEFVINTKTIDNLTEHKMSPSKTEKSTKSVIYMDYKCPPTAITNLSEF